MNEELLNAVKQFDSKQDNFSGLQRLLSKGANINYKDKQGFSVFDWAVKTGNLLLVKFLKTNGANYAYDSSEKNAYHIAIAKGAGSIVDFLITFVPDNKKQKAVNRGFLTAISHGQTAIVRFLLTESKPKADINFKHKNGNSALILATKQGDLELVKLIFSFNRKALFTDLDEYHRSTFEIAISLKHMSLIKYFLSAVDPRELFWLQRKYGETQLTILPLVKYSASKEMISFLLNQGAVVTDCAWNPSDEFYYGPYEIKHILEQAMLLIHIAKLSAADYRKVDKLKELHIFTELKDALNGRSFIGGYTALHYAIESGNYSLITTLLTHGADFSMPNLKNITPYGLGTSHKDPYIKMIFYAFNIANIIDKIKSIKNLSESGSRELKETKETRDMREVKSSQEKYETTLKELHERLNKELSLAESYEFSLDFETDSATEKEMGVSALQKEIYLKLSEALLFVNEPAKAYEYALKAKKYGEDSTVHFCLFKIVSGHKIPLHPTGLNLGNEMAERLRTILYHLLQSGTGNIQKEKMDHKVIEYAMEYTLETRENIISIPDIHSLLYPLVILSHLDYIRNKNLEIKALKEKVKEMSAVLDKSRKPVDSQKSKAEPDAFDLLTQFRSATSQKDTGRPAIDSRLKV